jgi:GWxTD domain-containing protein
MDWQCSKQNGVRWARWIGAVIGAFVGLAIAQPAPSQDPVRVLPAEDGVSGTDIPSRSPRLDLAVGAAAWSARDTAQALTHLRSAFEQVPALRMDPFGSAGALLGTILDARGDSSRARQVRSQAFVAQQNRGRVDPRLADDVLRETQTPDLRRHPERGRRAAAAYRSILRNAGTDLPQPADSVVHSHLARLRPVLPDSLKQALEVPTGDGAGSGSIHVEPGTGPRLLRWWRSTDPLPGTRRNERLLEHLERVEHATRHYGCPVARCGPAGWDARGTAYVRFGPPAQRESITYLEADFNLDVFRFGVPASRHEFPDNEIWIYSNVDRSGKYLFIDDGGRGIYEEGLTNELLPSRLRTGMGARTDRNLNRAVSALFALEHIYEQLASLHISYGDRYSRIANYANWQEEQASLVEMGVLPESRTRTVGGGIGQTQEVGPGPTASGGQYPTGFVSNHLDQSAARDVEDAKRRETRMPESQSRIRMGTSDLPVAVRTARFRAADGSTRVRIAWAHPSGAFALSESTRQTLRDLGLPGRARHAVHLRAVGYDAAHRRQQTIDGNYGLPLEATAPTKSRSVPLPATADPFHVRLQWDHRVVGGADPGARPAPVVKRQVVRLDSLRPLPTGDDRLVMSDILPALPPADGLPRPDDLRPYPFRSLGDRSSLALRFDVYNLTVDDDGQTHYSIAYEVRYRRDGGFLQADDQVQTETRSTVQGRRSTAREVIALDLGAIDGKGGSMQVTVRVTDEISGTTVERSVDFTVTEPSG